MSLSDKQIISLQAAKLSPVEDLTDANRKLVCKTASVVPIPPNKRLNASEEHRWLMYLIDGQVSIQHGKAEQGTLTSACTKARQPIFHSPTSHESALAKSPCTVLRFDREQTELLLREQQRDATKVVEVRVTEADNKVFDQIYEAFQKRKLKVPSLPDIAFKIRDAINKPNVGAAEVAQIIQSDPVLTGRLVNIANSPVARGVEKVSNLKMAVTRLGLEATRSLAFTLAVKQLYRGSNPLVTRVMNQLFSDSCYVAALSYVLARRVPHLDAERAQLAGLVHDIGGAPILHYADKFPEYFDSEAQLVSIVRNLSPIIGQWVLSSWEFDQELCDIPQSCRDWYRKTPTEINYLEIATAALLHHIRSTNLQQNSDLPALENIAIGRKLMDQGIDLSTAQNFFDEAKDEIAIAQSLIS
ncbi:MAG: HDOD domain-containing protein [Pseudomonadota bacterium]